ncbi:MAG: hypothetical protein JXX28_02020 [Deltaproteobacteria bacterium]|nr:hypothetical protein [Deltaproteobacteria bacterium]
MRQLWLSFGIPFLVVFVLAAGVIAARDLDLFAPVCEPVPVEFKDLDVTTPCVRVRGMAHYGATIAQHYPGNLLHSSHDEWLFPLFQAHDAKGRAVRVMVRSRVQPEARVSYEFMEIEGRITSLSPDVIPYQVEVQMGKTSDYFLTDDTLILEAITVHPWDGNEASGGDGAP